MGSKTVVPFSLDDYFKSTSIGSVDKAIANNLYGINHRQTSGMVPGNKDSYGLTFFTRPQLNLQPDNIRNVRMLYPLLNDNDTSIQRYVRCMLDPRLMHPYSFGVAGKTRKTSNVNLPISCSVVDNQQAFIPILTNNINSISGWPDITAPTFTSKSGLYNEAYSLVDGLTRNYESFDLTASFRNTRGDPILYMFYVWLHYSSLVHEGRMVPYPDFITENEIDYNTRIYRLVLDPSKDIVRKITATGASFPISVPTGSFFDYTNEKPYNDQNNEISIVFKCMGVDYLDDILIDEFNKTAMIFNGDMKVKNQQVGSNVVKVNKAILPLFNNRGYPRINPATYELEWYVSKELFNIRTNNYIQSQSVSERDKLMLVPGEELIDFESYFEKE